MEGTDSLSEKILSTIMRGIYYSNEHLQDFSIIPVFSNNTNRSPVVFYENSVGMESWCVKYVYKYVYNKLLSMRNKVQERCIDSSAMEDVNRLLVGALLINPNVTTFWNMRRELMQTGCFNSDREMRFVKMVLTYKPKSNECFSYRRWMLTHIIQCNYANINTDQLDKSNILQRELDISELCALRACNNYHAWTHRIWCVENILIPDREQLVQSELTFVYGWIMNHVSEYCAYNYRQFLMKLLLHNDDIQSVNTFYYNYISEHFKLNNDDPLVFCSELMGQKPTMNVNIIIKIVNFVSTLLYDLIHTIPKINEFFKNHECVWNHRKFVIFHLLKILKQFVDNYDCSKLNVNESKQSSNVCTDNVNCLESAESATLYTNYLNKHCLLYRIILDYEQDFLNTDNVAAHIQKYKIWCSNTYSFFNIKGL